ncbi:ComGF family competence protein [Alteribacter populi]|uniref:ComGF family competence protein n=1 Tax=Alteribacter populi TaxID=2011011 RepID=UPI000BBAC450|nr:ComGF family competence protein [Alteribacter populi]
MNSEHDVYTNKRKEQGFTLLEVLTTLVLLFLISSLLLSIFPLLHQNENNRSYHEETALFFIQLQLKIRNSDMFWIDSGGRRLVLLVKEGSDEQMESFILHNQRVVRQVEGAGYDVYLEGVNDIYFTEVNRGVEVVIENTQNKQYTKRLNHMNSKAGEEHEQ